MSSVDPKLLEAMKRQESDEARQSDDDLRWVLGSRVGRRVMWRLLNVATGLYDSSFTAEALTTAYNEGRRSVGLKLMLELQRVEPKAYFDMMAEALEESRLVTLARESSTG